MNKLLELAKTKLGCGYVWGAQGEMLTEEKLAWFKNTFGESHYVFQDSQGIVDAGKWINKQVFDCSGLILWCLQQLGYIPNNQDYNAEMFYNQLCKAITKAELKEGDLIFIKTGVGEIEHIGIYEFDGKTVEAMSTRCGVVEGNVDRFNLFGRLKFDGLEVTDMNWKEIIEKVSDSPERWEKAINIAAQVAKVDGNLGDLEILEFLPTLIEKIYDSNLK